MKTEIDWYAVITPLLGVVIISILFMVFPENSTETIQTVRVFLGDRCGLYYAVLGLGIFLCSIYIAFSKYGKILLGKPEDKNQYSSVRWGMMIFTSTMAADILFYSLCEWALYANEPYIEELGGIQKWASTYPLFHWGPIVWSLYIVLAVAFGFMLPVLAGFIAMSIGDRPALAVGFVGGMIAASGKSGFLGALAAGFIAGYLVVLLRKAFAKLPEALEKIAPVLLYPLLGILGIGLIMMFCIEPPIGALNTALNTGLTNMGGTSKILLGIVVAGMMSIDMGGPFNKAAYVFGTASIAAGNYDIMAAVMVGGMVPPLAIALATMFFKNKFTEEERKAGPTNIVMGLSFISEGAIPFAASDPLRVLPSCIIGSAVAGALSMAFNCTLMAPHGGIFVFLTVGHPLLYLVSLAVGSVVGCVILGLLKKDVSKR